MVKIKMSNLVGLGSSNARLNIYIKNRPPLDEYQNLDSMKFMLSSEVLHIGRLTGNHWRKIFNVFAKLMFELNASTFPRWQDLRDQYLLQSGCNEALLFSLPCLSSNNSDPAGNVISIIMGKAYALDTLAKQSKFAMDSLLWISEDFAISKSHRLIVCPYFDYRQLSNIKITRLVKLINSLDNSFSNE